MKSLTLSYPWQPVTLTRGTAPFSSSTFLLLFLLVFHILVFFLSPSYSFPQGRIKEMTNTNLWA